MMMERARRAGVLIAVNALVGAAGCGGGLEPELGSEPSRLVSRMTVTVPDFVVASVRGPASVRPGDGFLASVTVCNQGGAGASADVELFLSPDAAIDLGDASIGGSYVGWLEPGQCSTREIFSSAWVPGPGNYYLGAIADRFNNVAEADESNNALAGMRMGVGDGPDFIVQTVSGPASAQLGGNFSASVTVCNQGTSGGSTGVELFLSQDTSIRGPSPSQPSNADMPIGGGYMGWLEVGQCVTQQVPVYANAPNEGAWYLGAIADMHQSTQELLEDNNTQVGTRMGVGSRPDFVVREVTGPASVRMGGSFNASVTVCNQGTSGGSTDMDLFLSSDALIDPSDLVMGGAPVGWLEAGQCRTQQVPVYANVPHDGAWDLGAIVDPRQYTQELMEDNNALAGTRLGVGYKPDFVVQAVSGPASSQMGGGFTASVTVCNQGTSGGSAEVDLFLSKDEAITPGSPSQPYNADPFLGSTYVGWLEAGQCATQSVPVNAYVPDEGAWYLGAIADPRQYTVELLEDNNARAGTRMGVGYGPDFVVQAVSGPASSQMGGSFTASVTVCNQGTAGGHADVELFLSKDTTISGPSPSQPYNADPFVGMAPMGYLQPGQCAAQQVPVNAYVPEEGVWYLGAIVDPRNYMMELLEDNNALAGTRMGLGYRPDFVVQAVSGPASAQLGGNFSASVTVCNQGTSGGSTGVELFLSQDTSIRGPSPSQPSNADMPIGGGYMGWLEAGQCVTQQVPVYANAPNEGAWYLGAIADMHQSTQELLEDNNVRAGTRMGLGSRPDFVVREVTGPASAQVGGGFTASVTVCNQGTSGGNADVDLFLSKDETISLPSPNQPYNASDIFLGSAPGGWLEAGQCVTQQVPVYANVPADGVWFLGAIVDPRQYTVELLEDNNARAGTRMGVGYAPDFVVQAVTGPASSQMGGSFTASVTVCNQGTSGGSAEVDLFLSKDEAITPGSPSQPYNADPFLGSTSVGGLQPGQCATQQVPVNANVPNDGVWYLGAIVDPRQYTVELLEGNNARAGTRMGVGYAPDFVVQVVTGPASSQMGGSFTASVTVCNQGTAGGHADVELFLSKDTTISGPSPSQPYNADPFVGMAPMGYLQPGQCAAQQVPVNAYVPEEGVWYLGAIVDPRNYMMELLEDNNALAGTRMGLGYRPDFVVQSVSGPASAQLGGNFSASVTVCNQGTSGGSTGVELFLSQDTSIRGPSPSQPYDTDMPIGGGYMGWLEAGQCVTQQVPVYANAPDEGAWYLGAIADMHQSTQELLEDNNTQVGTRMGLGSRPDFVVREVTGPASAQVGGGFTASVTVCNQGTSGGSTDVDLFLSKDETISLPSPNQPYNASDIFLGSAPGGWLEAGQCVTRQVPVYANVPADGVWFLGAVVDPRQYTVELLEDNNARAGTRMGVGYGPDFVVQAVTGPASSQMGGGFTASVTVCNQGTSGGSAEVDLFLSKDTTISGPSPSQPYNADPFVGMAPMGYLQPGQCATQQVPVNANVPNDGVWFLGAIADPRQYTVELLEGNNARAGTRMGVGYAPDFVVQVVTGPASSQMGGSFTASVTVCNQGTAGGHADVELFLSRDTTISGPSPSQPYNADPFVGMAPMGYLQPGQCAAQQVPVNAYVPEEGVWYLGAIVDPRNYMVELLEDNNALAGSTLDVLY